ncbi:hypothetical protein KRM28CT15_36710 [Krasilnikovia sp. M28-CT-15]
MPVDDAELLTVGQVARRAGLTTRALRHYDRVGLLRPQVDPDNGYRRYAPRQVALARLIAALRAADVPLEQVRACLAAPDDEALRRRVLLAHRTRLRARLDRLRGELHSTEHLLTEGITDMPETTTVADQRQLAVDLFNGVWRLLEKEDRTVEDDDRMVHMAHASRYHWGEIGAPENRSRGEWQCARVYAVLERGEPALHHARRGLDICTAHGIGDWDLAFAYEALARAAAVAGDADAAREWTGRALAAAEKISDPEDRRMLLADLETIPGQARFW